MKARMNSMQCTTQKQIYLNIKKGGSKHKTQIRDMCYGHRPPTIVGPKCARCPGATNILYCVALSPTVVDSMHCTTLIRFLSEVHLFPTWKAQEMQSFGKFKSWSNMTPETFKFCLRLFQYFQSLS